MVAPQEAVEIVKALQARVFDLHKLCTDPRAARIMPALTDALPAHLQLRDDEYRIVGRNLPPQQHGRGGVKGFASFRGGRGGQASSQQQSPRSPR